MARNDEKNIRCSFCGKHSDQVRRIIAGPNAYICNECVQLCMSILDDGYAPEEPVLDNEIPDVIPTPREIHAVLDQYIIGQEKAKVALSVADDILVQNGVDLLGGGDHVGNFVFNERLLRGITVIQDAHAQLHTLIADVSVGAGDDPADLVRMLATEGTANVFLVVSSHGYTS